MTGLAPGDRIRLLAMPDDPSPIPAGEEGVVGQVQRGIFGDGTSQVSVKWDSGRTLSLVVPPDAVEVIGHEAVPEPWATYIREKEGA